MERLMDLAEQCLPKSGFDRKLLLGFTFFGIVAVNRVRVWWRLRHIPGPWIAGWLPVWHMWAATREFPHEVLKAVSEKYGPLVRIGPNLLLSTDVGVTRHMSSARSTYTKGDFYDSAEMTPGTPNVVSERTPAVHKQMRAKVTPGFSGKENEGYSFESGVDRQLSMFIDLIERKYISDEGATRPMDLAEKAQFFALDSVCEVAMGKAFGYLEQDKDLYNFNTINVQALPVINMVSALPTVGKIFGIWPLYLLLPGEEDEVGFGRLIGLASKVVDERLRDSAPELRDMMQAHINNGLSRDQLIQQVMIAIAAGSNTTAHTLRMAMLCLMTSPATFNALRKEIDTAGVPEGQYVSRSQAQEMPFLQGCIREVLRLRPAVVGLGNKEVPAGGDTLNGYYVPEGTNIGQNFYGIGHDKDIFGPDADVFRPDRWVCTEGEQLRSMINAVDSMFGHGRFGCLGKGVAMLELQKALFELVRRYDFAVLDEHRPIKTIYSIFAHSYDFWVRVTRRQRE